MYRWFCALTVILAVGLSLPLTASAADPLISTNKTATASSQENNTNTPAKAFDQNTTTRWASVSGSNPQWIYVDLGSSYRISRVKLNWETAYASGYRVEVSNDATTWTQIYSTTTGDGGIDDLTGFDALGRYVRMYATVRGTYPAHNWGYSLWEMEVYGAAPLSTGKTATASSTNGTNTAAKAFDQNRTTRWESAASDPQWVYVDLGASYTVQRVRLDWEAAYASGYRIETSNDATNWTQVYSTTTGDGGYDDITGLNITGRYVRMYGTVRGTYPAHNWGYSLWEMEVYGVAAPVGDPLQISTATDRTGYVDLQGYTVASPSTQVCVTLSDNPTKTGPVDFYLDGASVHTEGIVPWDYFGTDDLGGCLRGTFTAGSHTIRATWSGGEDSSTFSVTAATTQCGDGLDNDSDGLIDYPADPDCTSTADTNEGMVPNGPSGNWTLAWQDEFSGTSLDTTKWNCSGYTNNNMTNGSDCSNVTEASGKVKLVIDSGTNGAQIVSDGASGYALPVGGVAEARVYFSGDPANCNGGIYNWGAWWVSGPNWPNAGETDVAEVLSGQLSVNYHGPTSQNGPKPAGCWANAYHIYTVHRLSTEVRVYWDGNLVWTHTTSDNGNAEQMILTQGYSGTNVYGDAGAVYADYVRAWSPA